MTEFLLAGALSHLVRYQLTGCTHSAHVAAQLLDQLADRADVDGDTRSLCGHMSTVLETTGNRVCHV
jgi:hypothetical protein